MQRPGRSHIQSAQSLLICAALASQMPAIASPIKADTARERGRPACLVQALDLNSALIADAVTLTDTKDSGAVSSVTQNAEDKVEQKETKKEEKKEEKAEKKAEKKEEQKEKKVKEENQDAQKNVEKAEKRVEKKEEKTEDKAKAEAAAAPAPDRSDAPCISWVKVGVPVRAVILCVHGLGLNSASWTKFGQDLSQLGVATYAIDVRGFGSWEKAQGHENVDFKKCVNDVEVTLRWLHKSNPNKPVFLMGESMGGAIALHVAADAPELMDGVISVCSSGDRFKQKRTDLKVFVHLLMGPHRKFDIGDKIVDQASGNDTTLKQEWEGDKLDQMKLSPVELIQFQRFMNENHDEAKKITNTPVLMVQGRKDPLVKPEGTEELFKELKTPDKQIMMVENAKHLIFEEQQFSNLTLAEVSSWIFKHCPKIELPTAAFDAAMEKAHTSMSANQYAQAERQLQTAIKLIPGDANAHYLLGVTFIKENQPIKARIQLNLASRLGRGTQISHEANRMLLTLPQNVVAPHLMSRKVTAPPAGQPTVLVFNASWCQPCLDMNNVLAQAKEKYGTRVKFQVVDVDDKANADLIEHYSIGPVPTTVFLTPAGDVATFQVGYAGMDGMIKGLQKLVPPLPAH